MLTPFTWDRAALGRCSRDLPRGQHVIRPRHLNYSQLQAQGPQQCVNGIQRSAAAP